MGEEIQKAKNDSPVKVDKGPKRFVEKGPHVVLDTKTGIFWTSSPMVCHVPLIVFF